MFVSISARYSGIHGRWLASVSVSGVMHQQATGDTKSSAVAKAVAGFRATRFLRKASL